MVDYVGTNFEVDSLVALLTGGRQPKPICVVTVPGDRSQSRFDSLRIDAETSEVAMVFEVESGDLTRRLQSLLPEHCQVFGGAARCYPVDFHKHYAGSVSSLFYPHPVLNLQMETQKIISSLWGMANSAGLLKAVTSGATLVEGEVSALYGGELAIVRLGDGELYSLRGEVTFPGVPLDKVLLVGQKLKGYAEIGDKTFRLAEESFGVEDLVSHYGLNSVTSGLVRSTTRKSASVAMHPNLVFEVRKDEITGNPHDLVNEYYQVGEVYAFRIYRDPQGRIRIKSSDIDDDEEVLPALALLPGALPWLEPGIGILGSDELVETALLDEGAVVEYDPTTELKAIEEDASIAQSNPASPLPNAGGIYNFQHSTPSDAPASGGLDTSFMVNYYKGTIQTLLNEKAGLIEDSKLTATRYNDLARELDVLKAQRIRLNKEVQELKQDLKSAKSTQVQDPWASLEYFEDYDQWLNYELNKYWVENYSVDDKRRFKLLASNWYFGDKFFENFSRGNLPSQLLRKLIRTLVELLSGRPAGGGTERHPLTQRLGGSQQIRHSDGGRAMRMYVEEVAASARRLHYWELPGGKLELSRVGVHDDYTIY